MTENKDHEKLLLKIKKKEEEYNDLECDLASIEKEIEELYEELEAE